jgi:hypothetical protein
MGWGTDSRGALCRCQQYLVRLYGAVVCVEMMGRKTAGRISGYCIDVEGASYGYMKMLCHCDKGVNFGSRRELGSSAGSVGGGTTM